MTQVEAFKNLQNDKETFPAKTHPIIQKLTVVQETVQSETVHF